MDVFRDEGAETGGEGLFSAENGAWEEPAKSTAHILPGLCVVSLPPR